VLERCGLLKERSILIDFRGKNRGFNFNFDFFWLPKCEQYTGLTEKNAYRRFYPCPHLRLVADFGGYSRRFWPL